MKVIRSIDVSTTRCDVCKRYRRTSRELQMSDNTSALDKTHYRAGVLYRESQT
jgi:hypothetical protein